MFENYSSFYTQAPIFEAHYLLDHWLQFSWPDEAHSLFISWQMKQKSNLKLKCRVCILEFFVVISVFDENKKLSEIEKALGGPNQ